MTIITLLAALNPPPAINVDEISMEHGLEERATNTATRLASAVQESLFKGL
jgi:hypothetical protein